MPPPLPRLFGVPTALYIFKIKHLDQNQTQQISIIFEQILPQKSPENQKTLQHQHHLFTLLYQIKKK